MAIHLNSRGLAFVIFEGELAPLDWSIVEARGSERREKILARIDALFARFRPNVVVLEAMSEVAPRRPQRIRSLNEAIMEAAKKYAFPTVFFSRAAVRQQFTHLGTVTKEAVAMAIAKHIPAFERFLPGPRKPWESEDARMGIFDAAALALTFYHTRFQSGV
ncbi:hypothetical protein NLM33_32615 [Bradyrhizobium sp. CCGUVB1N3]|uniref:hypothetical protein n=1 Tax=Bradyrhizobium sp. CCGUVB1N3 TaxID=2949629 RepID=UPI0020B1B1C8|nr:hypothetical protein [Bradyrhizobium sp. CCGUVB1N3]MCP3475067.1 hypothetical protein [Bradyrhizobium sp. CCGUVB1N3]